MSRANKKEDVSRESLLSKRYFFLFVYKAKPATEMTIEVHGSFQLCSEWKHDLPNHMIVEQAYPTYQVNPNQVVDHQKRRSAVGQLPKKIVF